jgi:competence protein ComEC
MTDGDVALIDDATTRDFRTTGLAHLVAVSGYNVAVFLALVMLFVRAIAPRGRWLRVALAVPALVVFAFLTGLEPSVLRATVSAGVALAVVAGGRTTEALRSIAFAFVVLILASPEMLFDPGFQLSFGATLGIVVGSEPISARLLRILPDSRIGRAVAVGLGTTIAAQVSVAPLLAWHFGRIPGIGAFANVVAIPLAGLVMVGGMFTLSAASVTRFMDWAPAMMRLPLDAILASAHGFARLPAASIALSTLAAVAVTAALVVAFSRSARVRVCSAALAVVCVGVVGGRSVARSGCDAPAVDALDIGQGTAVLLRTPGHAVLVDAGPADGGVVRQLKTLGVGRLDAIVVTHSHIDHALGAVSALRELEVGRVLGPPELRWAAGAQVIRAASVAGVPFEALVAGDAFDAGDALHVDVLWPEGEDPPPFDEDLVDRYSLVVRARLAAVGVLLPGDIRAEQQSELAEDGDVAAPILIAVHHGSKNLDAGFVEAVDPALTLVTVGAQNPYGLPAPEAIRAYSRHGRVFRTDQDGHVSVCVGDGRAEVMTER